MILATALFVCDQPAFMFPWYWGEDVTLSSEDLTRATSLRNSVLDFALLAVTQGQRLLVRTRHVTGRWRADWMMEGSGGETTAMRMFGSCMRTSRALLRLLATWNSDVWSLHELVQRSLLPVDTITSWKEKERIKNENKILHWISVLPSKMYSCLFSYPLPSISPTF